MARPLKSEKPARQKIIESANKLFYEQGYFQTGINQIIEQSGISKATFYTHFKTKEELAETYLKERDQREIDFLNNAVEGNTPDAQLSKLFISIREWQKETKFRGCGFANIAVEVTNPDSPLREVVRGHDTKFREILERIVAKMIEDSPSNESEKDAKKIADQIYLLVEGCIAASQHYSEAWPIDAAMECALDLIPR